MADETQSGEIVAIVAQDDNVRGLFRERRLKTQSIPTDQLSKNISSFVSEMKSLVDETPEEEGKFQLAEIEVYAEITGTGQMMLLGVGGELGVSGGIKFVFKKT